MQATAPTQTAPATAQPPAAPQTPSAPTTAFELRELRARRDEISRQLSNVTSRRDEIAGQLRNATTSAEKAGLEGRLASLDRRILELENDLNVTGRQLASARGQAAIAAQDPPPSNAPGSLNSGQQTAIAIVFTLAVLMPLSMAWARSILRRSAKAGEALSREVIERLDRLEQGVEAVAIEVERISEGQRFVSRLIGEGAAPTLRPARPEAEPAAVAKAEAKSAAKVGG